MEIIAALALSGLGVVSYLYYKEKAYTKFLELMLESKIVSVIKEEKANESKPTE